MNVRGLAFFFLVGGALVAPSVADAQYRDDGYGRGRAQARNGRMSEAYQRALDRGYEDGRKEGVKDARRNERRDFRDEDKYRDGDAGYKSSYGSRREYTQTYRRGYAEGYREAYALEARGRRNGSRVIRENDRYGSYGAYGDYDDSRYEVETYDWQRDGRHRHRGESGWHYDRHDAYDGNGRVIREVPRH